MHIVVSFCLFEHMNTSLNVQHILEAEWALLGTQHSTPLHSLGHIIGRYNRNILLEEALP